MSKRIQFSTTGGSDVLEWVEVEPVAPAAGEVRIANKAVGLNFIDIYFRTGLYPAPSMPSGLGTEGAGIVDAVGEGVTHLKVGDRVAYAQGPLGAYAELHTLPAAKVVKLPGFIDFETAAASMLKGLTVQYLLRQTQPLKGGETILFHAAAGGVGTFLTPLLVLAAACVVGGTTATTVFPTTVETLNYRATLRLSVAPGETTCN